MDYFVQQNCWVGGELEGDVVFIWVGGKYVVVIGGGDMVFDCVGIVFCQGVFLVI